MFPVIFLFLKRFFLRGFAVSVFEILDFQGSYLAILRADVPMSLQQ
jgi:hypothetical protein